MIRIFANRSYGWVCDYLSESKTLTVEIRRRFCTANMVSGVKYDFVEEEILSDEHNTCVVIHRFRGWDERQFARTLDGQNINLKLAERVYETKREYRYFTYERVLAKKGLFSRRYGFVRMDKTDWIETQKLVGVFRE